MSTKKLKASLRSGATVHGCWINLGSTVSAEIIGSAGFDWVLVDLEHGAGDEGDMYRQLQVLAGTPATALVRTSQVIRPMVQHILDAGASGVMFPQIQDAESAREAVRMMYYPPKGSRGMAPAARAARFGQDLPGYLASMPETLLGIIQIETLGAVEDIDRIAAIEEVDILFVGPSDLTLAMGIFGRLDHQQYQEAIRKVAGAAAQHGKAAGVLLRDPSEYFMYHDLGYRFLACGADSTFVARSATNMVRELEHFRQNAGNRPS